MDTAQQLEVALNRLEILKKDWAPVLEFAQSNGDALGLRPGDDITLFLIETMKKKVLESKEADGPDADGLVRSMVIFLETDVSMGEQIMNTDRAWLVMAQAYIKRKAYQDLQAANSIKTQGENNGNRV